MALCLPIHNAKYFKRFGRHNKIDEFTNNFKSDIDRSGSRRVKEELRLGICGRLGLELFAVRIVTLKSTYQHNSTGV